MFAEETLEGLVPAWVVGGSVLPAVPDDEEPGAGEDADGVGMVVAASSGSVVEVGGPGAGVARVAGEVGDGVAELLVAGPAEGDCAHLAGLAGGGRGAGQAGEGLGGGEPGAAVADLGQEAGGTDGTRAGQAGEDVAVGVGGQLRADLGGQDPDLLGQGDQDGTQRAGDRGLGGRVGSGEAAGRGGQPGVQDGGVSAAAVADAGQPPAEPGRGEPVGPVLGVEAGQERQADRRVELSEQPGGGGEDIVQV